MCKVGVQGSRGGWPRSQPGLLPCGYWQLHAHSIQGYPAVARFLQRCRPMQAQEAQRSTAQHRKRSTESAAHLGVHAHDAVVLGKQVLEQLAQRVAMARPLRPAPSHSRASGEAAEQVDAFVAF